MILAIKDLAVSSGSAWTSSSLEPSYVLRALGVDEAMAHTSIRFGFGRFTTEAEVLLSHINKPRDLSPLWEVVQEGIDINEIIFYLFSNPFYNSRKSLIFNIKSWTNRL